MEYIYSKNNQDTILHIIHKKNDFSGRQDIVNESEFLQVAPLKLQKDQTFKPHKHVWVESEYKKKIAQESWVVISGSVEVYYYDLDNNFLKSEILIPGDCTITLQGGHNYKSLEDNTKVYEFKTGPYLGQKLDKEFI